MKKVIFIISALALALVLVLSASTPPAGRQWKKWSNPLFEGWYADPEGIVIDDQLWIYPTYSKPFKEQLHLDAFSSKDLKKWTKHERIISNVEISWLKEALWAPSIVNKDGKYAKTGTIDTALLNRLLKDKYILKTPPKTVKRDNFMELYKHVEGSSLENGAATLTAFIAHVLKKSTQYLNNQPKQWILIGGGIYNPTLIQMIKSLFKEPIKTAFDLNWQNDTLNASAYAFLAARCVMGLPISYPSTTGSYEAVTGGQIFTP